MITDAHVQTAIAGSFSAEHRTAAAQAMSGNVFGNRTRLAILVLAKGSLPELERLTQAAANDSRDVLFWAEYPEAAGTGTRNEMAERYRQIGAPVPPSLLP